jgi:hypothetical protein
MWVPLKTDTVASANGQQAVARQVSADWSIAVKLMLPAFCSMDLAGKGYHMVSIEQTHEHLEIKLVARHCNSLLQIFTLQRCQKHTANREEQQGMFGAQQPLFCTKLVTTGGSLNYFRVVRKLCMRGCCRQHLFALMRCPGDNT